MKTNKSTRVLTMLYERVRRVTAQSSIISLPSCLSWMLMVVSSCQPLLAPLTHASNPAAPSRINRIRVDRLPSRKATTVAPVVTITAPLDNSTFAAGSSITISAAATDSDGTISKVEFFQGTTKLGEAADAPYAFVWGNVAAGHYALTAVATDNLGASATSSPVNIEVTFGLVGYWKFDEGSGTTVSDSSGQSNHGALLNGATWAAGRAGSALSLDGVDDYVSASANAMPAANAAQSISWWQYVNINPTDVQCIIDLGNETAGSTVQAGYRNSQFGVWKYGGEFLVSTTAPTENAWHHYAYTFDGITHRIYINGVEQSSSTNAPNAGTPDVVEFGRWKIGAEYFRGQLDEVRIYNRVLIKEEVKALATLNSQPMAGVTSPDNGARFVAPANITISAAATDSDGTISKVEFFQGTTKLGEAADAPYAFVWGNVAAGHYALTAVATDNLGASATSSPVNIEVVADGPVITSFTPTRGSVGTTVTLLGTALKVDGGETTVTFTGDGGTRVQAPISMPGATEIRAVVPNGAVTGFIELTNALGRATTSTAFTIDASQDFQLTVSPTTADAIQRSTATQVITLTSIQSGFTQLARLSVTGLPAGVNAQFEPPQITAGATSTLSLLLSNIDLAPGSYPFMIHGAADVDGRQIVRTAPATLSVITGGQTTLTGRVLSTNNEPIMGATASLDGRSATTDSAGVFLLTGITAGTNRPVMIDGRTASAPNRTFPAITEPADAVAGQANVVPFTFFLPPVDVQHEVMVVPNQATLATNPRVPDLEMIVPAGARLRNRDNTPVTRVSITPLAIDRTPAPLPANVATNLVFTSQPGGAITDILIPVVYPNLAGANPGTRVELYAFNHDTVRWYVYGYGRVSADGRTITPEINPATGRPYGLPDFSWHFPNVGPEGNPGPPCGKGDCCGGGGGNGGGGNGGGSGAGGGDGGSGGGGGGGYVGGGGESGGGGAGGSYKTSGSFTGGSFTSNPVDLSTGIKIEAATDIMFGGARGQLMLERIYTSDLAQSCDACPFGRGTTHNYAVRLTGTFQPGGAGRVVMPGELTGRLFSYARTGADGTLVFTSTATTRQLSDVVRKSTDGTLEYRYSHGGLMRFDPAGRLISVVDRNGNTTTFAYTGSNLTRITDPVGRSITLDYSGNRITSATDPLGRIWQYDYEGGSGLTGVTDPLGNVTRYGYSAGGRLASITDPRGNIVKQIAYDGNGRVSEQKYADDGVERYVYTLSGRIVTSAAITDPLGRTQTKRFNASGYVIAETDALGQSSRIERDTRGLPISVIGPCGCAEAVQEFDERGNLISITDRLGQIDAFEYDVVFNKITKFTDGLRRETRYGYDARGNLTSVTNALNQTTRYEYDQFGQLTSIIDPLSHVMRLEYDADGNTERIIDALGNRMTMEYDQIGRMKAQIDPLNRRTMIVYDDLSRVASMTDPAGVKTILAYDDSGNLESVSNAQDKRWRRGYDDKNRLRSVTDPLGRVTRYRYNASDEVVEVISPSGRATRYEYDPRGHVATITDPLGGTVRFTYDTRGNLVTLINQRYNTTTFTYDELYRLKTERDPTGHSSSFIYDAVDNVTEQTDRLGRRTSTNYDALDRPIRIAYADAVVTYTYDEAGRRTRVDDTRGGIIEWSYDDANRLLTETTADSVVAYTYNEAYQRASLRVADCAPVTYAYDTAGRLRTITQGEEVFTYRYDTLSRLAELQRPNGVKTTYTYNAVDMLERLTHTNGLDQAIEDYRYTYNSEDEIARITSLALGQILSAAQTVSPADAANRIVQFGQANFSFDENGQTKNKTVSLDRTSYEWDARGRMTQATLPNGLTISYVYDALGRRTGRTADGLTTKFLYDDADVVLDRGSDGSQVDYLNGPGIDEKLRQAVSGVGLYFLQDHLGSTAALTDAAGNVVERMQYEAYGAGAGGGLTRYEYNGREREVATGLLYYRARWYDPGQSRFLSEDSVGFTGWDINLYAYVRNNPVNWIDPLGLKRQRISGIYEFISDNGRRYIGQSVDIARRIGQHVRSGKLPRCNLSTLIMMEMSGDKAMRDMAEQRWIELSGGLQNLANRINVIAGGYFTRR